MESPAVEAASSSSKDKVLLLLSAALFVGGLLAFYYFDPKLPQVVRVIILLAAFAASVAVSYKTELGQNVVDAVAGIAARAAAASGNGVVAFTTRPDEARQQGRCVHHRPPVRRQDRRRCERPAEPGLPLGR